MSAGRDIIRTPVRISGHRIINHGRVVQICPDCRTEKNISRLLERDDFTIPGKSFQILCLPEININFCTGSVTLITAAVRRHIIVVVSNVGGNSHVDLLHIRNAGDRPASLPGGVQCRQQQGSENRYYRNNNKKFYYSEFLFLYRSHLFPPVS